MGQLALLTTQYHPPVHITVALCFVCCCCVTLLLLASLWLKARYNSVGPSYIPALHTVISSLGFSNIIYKDYKEYKIQCPIIQYALV